MTPSDKGARMRTIVSDKAKPFSREEYIRQEMGKRHPSHTMFEYWPTYTKAQKGGVAMPDDKQEELVISDELKAQLETALEESRKNRGAPYHYEESDEPTEMVTKFFGKIMQGTSFVARIGTKGANEYVEFLNAQKPTSAPQPAAPLVTAEMISKAWWDAGKTTHSPNQDFCELVSKFVNAALAGSQAPVPTPTDEELSRGTFACPICGRDYPHSDDAHRITPTVPTNGICQKRWMYDEVAYVCRLKFGHEGKHDWTFWEIADSLATQAAAPVLSKEVVGALTKLRGLCTPLGRGVYITKEIADAISLVCKALRELSAPKGGEK